MYEHGVLEPIIVVANGDKDRYQIIAGERRWIAAKAASLETIPAVVRKDLTEAQCREIAAVENLQRSDLHPIDEAAAIQALLDLDGMYTIPAIALRFSKSEDYIRRRLRLRKLGGLAATLFLEEVLTAEHAAELTRLSVDEQERAIRGGAFLTINFDTVQRALKALDFDTLRQEVAAVGSLRSWIKFNAIKAIADDEVQEKLEGFEELKSEAEAAHVGILELSRNHHLEPAIAKKLGPNVLSANLWREVAGRGSRCPMTRRGVVVHGGEEKVLSVCTSQECAKHWPERTPAATHTSEARPSKKSAYELEKEFFSKARKKALADPELAKAIQSTKLSGGLVLRVLSQHRQREIEQRFGLKVNDKTAAAALASSAVLDTLYNRKAFAAVCEFVGYNFRKLEREVARLDAAKAKAAKGKTKPAKGKKTGKKR